MKQIIDRDKVGFIPWMQGGFKIQKSIHHINTIKKNIIISADEDKPFDKIFIHWKKSFSKYREGPWPEKRHLQR